MIQFFVKHKTNIFYGVLLGIFVFVLNWLELRFVIFEHSTDIYVGAIAIIFTCLGIWLAKKLTQPKIETVIVEKHIYPDQTTDFILNEKEMTNLGISKRELEVLQLMATGLSNEEIGKQLYVSLNTIKTHSSKIFEKMDVKRRTQAIEKAKRLCLIP